MVIRYNHKLQKGAYFDQLFFLNGLFWFSNVLKTMKFPEKITFMVDFLIID